MVVTTYSHEAVVSPQWIVVNISDMSQFYKLCLMIFPIIFWGKHRFVITPDLIIDVAAPLH